MIVKQMIPVAVGRISQKRIPGHEAIHKAKAFSHDQLPSATPKPTEVYVMVEGENLPEGKSPSYISPSTEIVEH